MTAPRTSMRSSHLVEVDGVLTFQSNKYPTCPPGKVPLSVKDKSAQPELWRYAQTRRAVDADFTRDLETALRIAGYGPPTPREADVRRAVAHETEPRPCFTWAPIYAGNDYVAHAWVWSARRASQSATICGVQLPSPEGYVFSTAAKFCEACRNEAAKPLAAQFAAVRAEAEAPLRARIAELEADMREIRTLALDAAQRIHDIALSAATASICEEKK
jgi:hypothetical protein